MTFAYDYMFRYTLSFRRNLYYWMVGEKPDAYGMTFVYHYMLRYTLSFRRNLYHWMAGGKARCLRHDIRVRLYVPLHAVLPQESVLLDGWGEKPDACGMTFAYDYLFRYTLSFRRNLYRSTCTCSW